jgi:hypothetical protein
VIAALLVVLARIFLLLVSSHPSSRIEAVLVDGTFGLYLGWVSVATIANIAAALTAAGFDGFGFPADAWGTAVALVAGTVGVLLAVRGRGRLAPALSLSWGLVWVAVARLTDAPEAPLTAIAAFVAVAATLLSTVAIRTGAGWIAPSTPVARPSERSSTHVH